MYESLKKLMNNSYAPYSKFKVAAIVEMKDGKFFGGVNVENANYTSICAERNAIATAVANGYKKGDFERIYVMLENGEIGWPCMACRQVILEFFERDKLITSVDKNGQMESHTVAEMCPYPFSEEDLKWKADL